LFHGGFFSIEFIILAISFFVFILFSKELSFSKPGLIMLLGMVLLYYSSSLFSGYNTGSAITESTRPLLLLMSAAVGARLEKSSFMKFLIIAASALGIIGLLSLCRIIDFKDFVYVYDGIKSLQSTMQYANSTAVLLICGIFSTRSFKNSACIAAEIILTVCLLFTHSKIAIAVYIILMIAEQLLLRGGISLRVILNSAGALLIYLSMQFLINAKLSFIALVVCVVMALLISEKTANLKRTAIKTNRLTTVLLITGILAAMLVSLLFTDTSTFMIRLLYYTDGIKALMHNPILGISPGGWNEYQYNYQSAQYYVSQIHNGILQIGLDAGVPAMLLFVALLALSLTGLIRQWRKSKETDSLYILLIFLTLICHGFLDFDFSYGNILIILGICISYGFTEAYQFKLSKAHKSLAVLLIVFLTCLGVSETMIFFAQGEFNKGNYSKASDYYEFAGHIRPYDADSDIMQGLCQAKLENTGYAEEVITQAYNKHPENRDIILKAMDIASVNKDFASYIVYQEQLLDQAPMQQDTYTNSIRYLDNFYRNNLIDETLYSQEKNKVMNSAVEANRKMSTFNKYLDFGSNINIDSLK